MQTSAPFRILSPPLTLTTLAPTARGHTNRTLSRSLRSTRWTGTLSTLSYLPYEGRRMVTLIGFKGDVHESSGLLRPVG